MAERIEYAWIERDENGVPFVAKTEFKGERLRTVPTEIYPAETVSVERPYTHPDGRTGTLRGTVFLAARIDPPEVKIGGDGKPALRPVVTTEMPEAQPWQTIVGPLYAIGPDEVTRYWEAQDRSLDDVKAEVQAGLRTEMKSRIVDAYIDETDATGIRAGGLAAIEAVGKAESVQAVYEVAVDWSGATADAKV